MLNQPSIAEQLQDKAQESILPIAAGLLEDSPRTRRLDTILCLQVLAYNCAMWGLGELLKYFGLI